MDYSSWRNANAESISHILTQEMFCQWGMLDYIFLSRCSQFISSIFQATGKTWNVHLCLSQTSLTEQVNGILKTMIAWHVGSEHRLWDIQRPHFRFALNLTVQESTLPMLTPSVWADKSYSTKLASKRQGTHQIIQHYISEVERTGELHVLSLKPAYPKKFYCILRPWPWLGL